MIKTPYFIILALIFCGCSEPGEEYSYYNKGVIALNTKAIKANPRDTEAYCNRGEAYFNEHEYNKAISDYTRAIEIDPSCASAYSLRGYAYYEQGRLGDHPCPNCFVQAIYDYGKALEIRPGEWYYNRLDYALMYDDKISLESAIRDSTRFIADNPHDARAYYSRAVFYFRTNNYDRAWEDLHAAAKLGYKGTPEFREKLVKASGRAN